jgi:hypothetical protein
MTIEFVLNVSLLKKIFSARESQCLDSAMSTICHIVERALQHRHGLLFSRLYNRSRPLLGATSVA